MRRHTGKAVFLALMCVVNGTTYAATMTTASRTSGVAPLAVLFNAVDEVNGVVQPTEVNGRREYADFYYLWDYGDPGAGSWTDSGKSKNQDVGYIACHVYDQPGTYTATLTVTTPTGLTYVYTQAITVQDPDAVYAGQNTICLSASGDFTGAPVGARQVTTANILDMETHIATGKRILLRRGDVWNVDGQEMSFWGEQDVTIGAFGPGTADERGLYYNAPLIHVANLPDSGLINLRDVRNWRVMDLSFTGNNVHGIMGGAIQLSLILNYRLQVEGCSTPLGNSYWETDGHDQYMIIGCDLHDTTGMIAYVGSERLAVMGNRMYNSEQTHILRVWQSYKGVISHNTLSGSSLESSSGRHALKFHGPSEQTLAATDETHLDHRSCYTVVYDNVFGTSGPWPVAIGPQDSGSEENLHDILITGNRFFNAYGERSHDPQALDVSISLLVWGRYMTVSNNIFDATDNNTGYTAIAVTRRGVEWTPLGNRVYNNTIVEEDTVTGWAGYAGISIGVDASQTTVQNNLIQFPAVSNGTRVAVDDEGTSTVADHNTLTLNAELVNSVSGDYLFRNYSLSAGAAGIDSGATVPVIYDFTGNARPRNTLWDLGAIEYGNPLQTPISVTVMDHTFRFHEAYAYPNPARPGQVPILRIVSGDIDTLEITIYDKSGTVVHTAVIHPMSPTGFSNRVSFYDYPWTGAKASGVYYAVIHGRQGSSIIKARTVFAVVK